MCKLLGLLIMCSATFSYVPRPHGHVCHITLTHRHSWDYGKGILTKMPRGKRHCLYVFNVTKSGSQLMLGFRSKYEHTCYFTFSRFLQTLWPALNPTALRLTQMVDLHLIERGGSWKVVPWSASLEPALGWCQFQASWSTQGFWTGWEAPFPTFSLLSNLSHPIFPASTVFILPLENFLHHKYAHSLYPVCLCNPPTLFPP